MLKIELYSDIAYFTSDFDFFGTNFYLQPYRCKTLGSLNRCRKWWVKIKARAQRSRDTSLVDAITELGLVLLLKALPTGHKPTSQTVMACLMERWSKTNHTFHLLVGEMTIAPSNVVAMTRFP